MENGRNQEQKEKNRRYGGGFPPFLMEKGASRVSSDGPQGPRSSGASKITVTRANASTSRQNKHVHHFHFECYFRVCAVFYYCSSFTLYIQTPCRGQCACIYLQSGQLSTVAVTESKDYFFPQRSGQPGFISVIKTVGVHVPVIKFPWGKSSTCEYSRDL